MRASTTRRLWDRAYFLEVFPGGPEAKADRDKGFLPSFPQGLDDHDGLIPIGDRDLLPPPDLSQDPGDLIPQVLRPNPHLPPLQEDTQSVLFTSRKVKALI